MRGLSSSVAASRMCVSTYTLNLRASQRVRARARSKCGRLPAGWGPRGNGYTCDQWRHPTNLSRQLVWRAPAGPRRRPPLYVAVEAAEQPVGPVAAAGLVGRVRAQLHVALVDVGGREVKHREGAHGQPVLAVALRAGAWRGGAREGGELREPGSNVRKKRCLQSDAVLPPPRARVGHIQLCS